MNEKVPIAPGHSNATLEQAGPLVLALDDASATLERVGGKGVSLGRMAAGGLPVPPGFHVTTAAYRYFIARHGLQEQILKAVSKISPDQPATLEEAAQTIARLFEQHPQPDEVARAVRKAYARLGGGDLPVAVRSSATAEDLPEMSFAGQQETYLNVRGDKMVLDAVKRCWASLWTAQAIGYRARNRIAPADVSLAVVVQEMVAAEAAGILFTANPMTGARDQLVINAAWGLGESIVGGQVTPDSMLVAKSDGSIIRQDVGDKRVMTVLTPTGTHEEPVPANKRDRPVLRPERAAELARIAVQIERLYGRPMDIEWAMHKGRPHIVQARPITALPDAVPEGKKQPPPDEWEMPEPDGKYIRASVTELLPDPLSPLFITLGVPAWEKATLEYYKSVGLPYFDDPLYVIQGYLYYNVSYTAGLLARMAWSGPRFLAVTLPRQYRTAEPRWRNARANYAAVDDRWHAADLATTLAVDLLRGVCEIVDEAARYYLTIQGGVLPAAYTSESMFTAAYRMMKREGDPAPAAFLLGFDSKPLSAEKSLYDLAQWIRERPGLADRVASASEEDLNKAGNAAWEEFRKRFAAHLATHGNTVYDLDFAKPLPAEEPAPILLALVHFLIDDATDPYERQRMAREANEKAVRGLEARRPGPWRWLSRKTLRWAQRMAPLREDALADVGLGWLTVRRLLHEVGRRLAGAGAIAGPDEVYLLRLDELTEAAMALDAGRKPVDSRMVVADRRSTWQAQRAAPPPHNLPIKGGGKILGIDFGKRTSGSASGDVIKGVSASPGRVTAPARVVHGPAEFDQMKHGDVLVAKNTAPAWTPLFALASAVVTDVGGPLSHSSIVAREYRIPAVLGTTVATEHLKNGQRITVDGDAGTVTINRGEGR